MHGARWAVCLALVLVAACSSSGTIATDPFLEAKIGFIFVGTRDDLGYNQAAWEASNAVAQAFPDAEVLREENVPETEAAIAALERMIARGARILFPTSFGHLPFGYEVARRHPNVIVVHQGGVEPDPELRNFGTYWGTVYEPVYLAGIAAGAATRTGELGFVAAFPIPATFNNINAFTLGARSVNPTVRTHVRFTGSWCDPSEQRSATRALFRRRVDVLTQHQDCTRTILRLSEDAGIWSVGYHEDGSEVARDGWLVGSVWNWRPLFVDIVRTILQGRFRGSLYNGNFRGGLRTGDNPFVLTEFGPGVGRRARALIRAAEERFRLGGSPFDGPLRDREGVVRIRAGKTPSVSEIDAMDYVVGGVVGRIPRG